MTCYIQRMSHGSQYDQEQEVESHASVRDRNRNDEEELPRAPPAVPVGDPVMVRQLATALTRIADAAPVRERKPPIEKLRRYGAKEFKATRTDDSGIAEYWWEQTIQVLEQLHCTEAEKVICATSLLVDEAAIWWQTIKRRVNEDQRTWEFFEREFKKRFITQKYLDAREREFIYLRQGHMTVSEYEREFTRLSKYALHMMTTELAKCKRFKE